MSLSVAILSVYHGPFVPVPSFPVVHFRKVCLRFARALRYRLRSFQTRTGSTHDGQTKEILKKLLLRLSVGYRQCSDEL